MADGARSRQTPYGRQEIAGGSKQEDRLKDQLREYYQEIIKRVSDADRILIFGPGEAKIELKEAIEKSKQLAVACDCSILFLGPGQNKRGYND